MSKPAAKAKGKKPQPVREDKTYQKPHDNRIYQHERLESGCYRRTVDFDRLDRK